MLIFAEETSPSLPMKHLCLLLLLLAVSPAAAISLVEATVYLKNGTTETYRDADRIELPCGGKPLKGLRDAFGKRRKITYRLDEIDSVVCWHPRSPERRHKFRPSTEVGWCWVYLETPHIGVHIYARRGYTIHTNGGISPLKASQWWGLSSTEVGIYLLKTGDTEFYALGEAGRRSQDAFRERICRYIADDPALCERIRASDALRSKTVVLLRDYRPSTH